MRCLDQAVGCLKICKQPLVEIRAVSQEINNCSNRHKLVITIIHTSLECHKYEMCTKKLAKNKSKSYQKPYKICKKFSS